MYHDRAMGVKSAATAGVLWMLVLALACTDRESPPTPPETAVETAETRAPDIVLSIDGVGEIPMLLDPKDKVVTRHILDDRIWEPTETHWFVRSIREGDIVVDVGANVGYYTLIAGRLVGAGGRVYAFEPEPEAFSFLERNVRLNGLENVVLEQKAVSNEAGSLRLYIAERNRGDHRIFQVDGEHRPYVEVESVVLDDYFGERAGDVDVVKIDTQGAEMVILQGMDRILTESEDLVLAVEYWPKGLHDFGVDPLAMLDLLESHDLRFFDLNMPLSLPLRAVDRAALQQTYRIRNKLFTNLLTVRSRVAALGPEAPGFPRPQSVSASRPATDQRVPQPGG